MSKDTLKIHIQSMTRQVRRRLWIQRLVRWSGVMLATTFAILIILLCTHLSVDAALVFSEAMPQDAACQWSITRKPIQELWCLLLLPWVIGALIMWPWKLHDIEFAKAIDIANGLKENLSSALAFLQEKNITPWMEAHLATTKKHIETAEARSKMCQKTFAIQRPQALKWAIILAVATLLPLTLHVTPAGIAPLLPAPDARACDWTPLEHAKHAQDKDAPTPGFEQNIDDATRALREAQLQELQALAQASDDEEFKKAADELNQILELDKNGELSADDFQKRLEALQEKLAQTDPAPQEQQERLDQTLAQALEELTQMKEDPDTQELAQALENKKYDEAAQILKELLNSVDPKDKKKLEKLAKMFGDLASKLDMTDPELREALQKNQDIVDKLEQQFAKDGKLTEEEKKAFRDAKKRMEDAQKQQEQGQDPASKSTQQLQKALDKTAQDLKNKAQNPADAENAPSDKPANSPDAENEEPGAQDAIEKPAEDGENPANTRQDMAKDAQDTQQGAEDALQNEAKKRNDQAKRDKLQDLANKMKQDAAQNNASNDEQSQADKQERAENMEDFLDRAKGNEGTKAKKQKENEDTQNGNDQQKDDQGEAQQNAQQQASKAEQAKDAAQQDMQPQGGQQQQGQDQPSSEPNDSQQAQDKSSAQQQGQMGQQTSGEEKPGAEQGNEQGQRDGIGQQANAQGGHSEAEGKSTQMDVQTVDEILHGQSSQAPTTREIIQTSGQSGFATEAYREVYQTYEHAAEEILENESVPQGYRHYIEKYFDMIRPQN